MNRLQPPRPVLEIAERLEDAGFEAWCVGGAVRDALLGHPHLDWDLATSATPTEVRALFGAGRTIPVGIEFGTVGVLDRMRRMHEVTTFRRDVRTDGRHAEVEFGVSLDDDLARRDFTINAIAYSPRRDEIRDPFDGRADLTRRLVRAVGDPDARMREDRLRALRAIRFAARFDFVIDPATRAAIDASAPYLNRLSRERVKQELDKTLEQVRCPSAALGLWQQSGALRVLVPPLDAPDARFAALDFLAQPGLPGRPARRMLRTAALLLHLAPRPAMDVLSGLRASRGETLAIGSLIERWHAVGPSMVDALTAGRRIPDRLIRRWAADIGRLRVGHFMRLASAVLAAAAATSGAHVDWPAVHTVLRRLLQSAFNDPLDLGSLAVDGDDLRRAGIPAGPGLGKILHQLLAAVIDDPARNTPDWLLQEAKQIGAGRPGETRSMETE